MSSIPRETYRFGQFELDVDAVELRRQGRRLKVQPQPFKLLVLLARRAGSLVGRDDIRTELWPEGTFVRGRRVMWLGELVTPSQGEAVRFLETMEFAV